MKKTIALILSVLIFAALLASCGGNKDSDDTTAPVTTEKPQATESPSTTNSVSDVETTAPVQNDLEGTLEEIFAKIYEKHPVEIMLGTTALDLENSDSVKYNTGLNSAADIDEGVISEAMIGSMAYSAFLIRVKDGADVNKIKGDILSGINPRKWICVGADKVIVGNSGNLIFMVMADSQIINAADVYAAFASIAGNNTGEMLEKAGN